MGVAYLRLLKLSTLIIALLMCGGAPGGAGALIRVLTALVQALVVELLLFSYWLTLRGFEDEASCCVCGGTLIGVALDFTWFIRELEDFRTLRDDFTQEGWRSVISDGFTLGLRIFWWEVVCNGCRVGVVITSGFSGLLEFGEHWGATTGWDLAVLIPDAVCDSCRVGVVIPLGLSGLVASGELWDTAGWDLACLLPDLLHPSCWETLPCLRREDLFLVLDGGRGVGVALSADAALGLWSILKLFAATTGVLVSLRVIHGRGPGLLLLHTSKMSRHLLLRFTVTIFIWARLVSIRGGGCRTGLISKAFKLGFCISLSASFLAMAARSRISRRAIAAGVSTLMLI